MNFFYFHQYWVWIQIRILLFSSLTFKMPSKSNFLNLVFLLISFQVTFTLFFQRLKSKRSHKTVGIKVFSSYFCLMMEGSRSTVYLLLVDMDPGGLKHVEILICRFLTYLQLSKIFFKTRYIVKLTQGFAVFSCSV